MSEQEKRVTFLENERRIRQHYAYMTNGHAPQTVTSCIWCGPICKYPFMSKPNAPTEETDPVTGNRTPLTGDNREHIPTQETDPE